MSRQAVAYVQGLCLADPNAERLLLLLAERTETSPWEGEQPRVMALDLRDADIPQLAVEAGIDADEFRRLLRALRNTVPMDVLEHPDGIWEIYYGPSYTNPEKANEARAFSDTQIGGIRQFTMPGWDQYSTWGYEEGLGHLYAQLYRNIDDPGMQPRIWITPPRYVVTTVDELAEAIATAIARYEVVPMPADMIKIWLTE